MDTRSTLAQNIEEFRKNKGLTQDDLAKLSDVSRASIGHWERGFRRPKVEQIQKMAAALSVKPAILDPFGIYAEETINEALSTYSIRTQIPSDLVPSVKELAQAEGITVEQYLRQIIRADMVRHGKDPQ